MKPRPLAPAAPSRRAAYTLMELLMATSMTAVVLVAALSGVVALQKSYAATEQYATGMADQMRLLDYLALDLRRAMTISAAAAPWAMDPDAQGLQINVPDYYHFNSADPQHLFPIANDPIYDPTSGEAYYSSAGAVANVANVMPHQVVAYRFVNGSITRTDPWQPLVSDGSGGYVSSGPVTIAYGMDAFPTLTPDPADTSGGTVHYNISFHSTFQPLATANASNDITLHNVTFVRSKNLTH